jgi:hypothetical protein
MKMADAIFLQNKNYFLSCKNINRACFKMLDKNIQLQYKVSNVTNMTGWNSTMGVCMILKQLEQSYGKPDMMPIHQNNLLFRSPFLPSEAPKMLLYCIEQCQEIQTIAEDLYTPKQIISNAVRLLMALGIFPLKEFDTWEAMSIKTYPILKAFVHEAYTRRLTLIQLQNTAGQQGYVRNNNMYNMFEKEADKVADDNTTITQTAAVATTGSTLGATYAAGTTSNVSAEVTPAINQLSANQMAMMNRMAAMQISPQLKSVPQTWDNKSMSCQSNKGRSWCHKHMREVFQPRMGQRTRRAKKQRRWTRRRTRMNSICRSYANIWMRQRPQQHTRSRNLHGKGPAGKAH